MVKALALSVLLAQSLPPLVQPNTTVTASQLSLPVSVSPNSSFTVTTAPPNFDAGIPVKPIVSDVPGELCCGTTPTPIPYTAGVCIGGQNLGPTAVSIFADGGNSAWAPLVQPGGSWGFCAVGVPYNCQSSVAQTDGGCLTADQTHQ